MKLALIPPRGWESWALRSNFHLALAQVSNPYYSRAYEDASKRADYIIVDNGAAEGTPVGDFKLYYQADRWGANEVVLPDVMYDGEATVARMKRYKVNLRDSAYLFEKFRYMGVAQGRSLDEVKCCIDAFAEMRYVQTVGIPRHLITTLKSRFIRLALAEWIKRVHPNRFEIHFLGTNPSVPSEIYRAAIETPWVRSVDTSMPFNYAIAGVALSMTAPAIGRPQNYLIEMQNMAPGLLRQNIITMQRWASANE